MQRGLFPPRRPSSVILIVLHLHEPKKMHLATQIQIQTYRAQSTTPDNLAFTAAVSRPGVQITAVIPGARGHLRENLLMCFSFMVMVGVCSASAILVKNNSKFGVGVLKLIRYSFKS